MLGQAEQPAFTTMHPAFPTMHPAFPTMHPAFPNMRPAFPTMQTDLMRAVPNMSNSTMTTNMYPLPPYSQTLADMHALAEDMNRKMQQMAPKVQLIPPCLPYTSPRSPQDMEVLSPQKVEQLSPYSPLLRQSPPQEELKPILQKVSLYY